MSQGQDKSLESRRRRLGNAGSRSAPARKLVAVMVNLAVPIAIKLVEIFAIVGVVCAPGSLFAFDTPPKSDKAASVMGNVGGKIKPIAKGVYAVSNCDGTGVRLVGQFSYKTTGGENRKFALTFDASEYRGLGCDSRVYFSSADCTGQARIRYNSGLMAGYVDAVVDTSTGEVYTTKNINLNPHHQFTSSSIGQNGLGCEPDISFYADLTEADKHAPLGISGPFFIK